MITRKDEKYVYQSRLSSSLFFFGRFPGSLPEMIDWKDSRLLGLETMCFTEHNNFDYPRTEKRPGNEYFLLNTDSYLYNMLRCRAEI